MAALWLSIFSGFSKSPLWWKQYGTNWLVTSNGFVRRIWVSSNLLDKQNSKGSESDRSSKNGKNAGHELRFGKICDKKPVRMVLEEGKLYSWCTCGLSKKQPFCDNSHRAFNEANQDNKSLQPFKSHKFQVDKKKEYSLCNCKQTKNRPFCDGSHKQKSIQEAVLS